MNPLTCPWLEEQIRAVKSRRLLFSDSPRFREAIQPTLFLGRERGFGLQSGLVFEQGGKDPWMAGSEVIKSFPIDGQERLVGFDGIVGPFLTKPDGSVVGQFFERFKRIAV